MGTARCVVTSSEEDPDIAAIRERLERSATHLGVAESLTGGMLSSQLAQAPGASEWFRGGIVAYASQVKHHLLDVPPGPVVSEQAALAMARGAARLLDAEIAVALTGVGGPDEQDGQPPGTVWLGTVIEGREQARSFHFPGDPGQVCRLACSAALEHLVRGLGATPASRAG